MLTLEYTHSYRGVVSCKSHESSLKADTLFINQGFINLGLTFLYTCCVFLLLGDSPT